MFDDPHGANSPAAATTVQDPIPLRTPHGPRGRLIVGNLPDFTRDPLKFVLQTSRDFPDDDIIPFYMVGQPLYLVNSPEMVRHILVQRPDNYIRRAQVGFDKVYLIQAHSLSATDGDVWRRSRRLMQPAFHQQHINRFADVITTSVRDMLDGWSSQPLINVSQSLSDMTLRLACQILLSMPLNTRQGQTITRALQVCYAFLDKSFSPIPTWVPLPGTLQARAALASLHRTLKGIIKEHHATSTDDLLSLLIDARDEKEKPLTDREIRYELISILIGGQDGTALSLIWTLALLAQDPAVQQRLQDEVTTVLAGRTPTLDDLPQLVYTRMVIDEALRLFPQFWATGRVAAGNEPDLVQGYRIKKGDIFLISPYVMHRHPKYWPEPDQFDPERFNPAGNSERPRGLYIPFGTGRRQCIGASLAQLEMQLTIAMIAQRYTLTLGPDGFPEPQVQFALRPREPLKLQIGAREASHS